MVNAYLRCSSAVLWMPNWSIPASLSNHRVVMMPLSILMLPTVLFKMPFLWSTSGWWCQDSLLRRSIPMRLLHWVAVGQTMAALIGAALRVREIDIWTTSQGL